MTIQIAGLATLIWWSLAIVFFSIAWTQRGQTLNECATVAVFWPLIVLFILPAMLWRIPFRTAAHIRSDLKNRRLLREFNDWIKAKEELAEHETS